MGIASAVFGQSSLAFEVASVKPNRTGGDANLDSRGGRLTATNITVRELIRVASWSRITRLLGRRHGPTRKDTI